MKKESLFWQFHTEENPNPSIVFGTIHLSVPESLIHWPEAQMYIDHYQRVFTESELSVQAAQRVQDFTLLPEGLQVHQFITQRRWNKMREVFLRYFEVDIDQLKLLRPLFILTQLQLKCLNVGMSPPLDQKIWNYALENNKSTMGLESEIEQINILRSLDIEGQYQQLVHMSKNISKTGKKLRELLKAYKKQDIWKMYRLSKNTLGKDLGILLRKRNEVLAERILKFHNEQSSFFSFGAGHLAGGHGVLRLIKKKGAILKPVMKKNSEL